MSSRSSKRFSTLLECAGQTLLQRSQFLEFAADDRKFLDDEIPHVRARLIRMAADSEKLTDFVQ